MHKNTVSSLLIAVTAASVLVILGCTQQNGTARQDALEQQFYQPFRQASAVPAKQIDLPDYTLNVGDMVEIIFHVKLLPIKEYRLNTEDIVTVRFPYHPKFDQTVTVQPDGKVRLLLIGEVDTLDRSRIIEIRPDKKYHPGLTVGDFERKIETEYGRFFKDVALTVTFKAANTKIEELKRAITTAPRGQSRLMPVKPDGNITLPFIRDVRAYGKTIEQVKADIDERYAEEGIPEIDVTVQILSVAPRKIFVMGEVHNPGLLQIDNMISLTHALAMAGGTTTRADSTKVLVIRRKDLPYPQGLLVDVDQILSAFTKPHASASAASRACMKDLWLDDYDLVYVPTSEAAKSNDWIEQVFTKGIYSVMPFSTSLGFHFGYQTYNAPSASKTSDQQRWNNISSSVWGR